MNQKQAKIFTFIFMMICSLLLSLFIYFCIYQKEHYEWEEWFMYQDVFKKLAQQNHEVDTIYLGDSRLKTIVKPKTHELNLALPNASPIESYFILKRYLKNQSKVKQIVLSFAPYHLIQTRAFFNRSIIYNFLSKKELDLVFQKSLELKDPHFDKYRYYKTKYLPNSYFTKVKTLIFSPKSKQTAAFKTLLYKNKGQTYFGKQKGSSELCDETTIKNMPHSPTIKYFLKLIIQLCKDNNIKVVYYTAPLNQTSCRALGSQFFKNHSDYLSKLPLNLLESSYCWPDKYFGDSSHLYIGADLAQQELRKQIQ
ncbi:MAG: hypothetical protein KC646_16915 [Candidatus Cloacimonetes bacterium]|nr:hypothetical protein [Candidatus Cloacimonadota bacterium]